MLESLRLLLAPSVALLTPLVVCGEKSGLYWSPLDAPLGKGIVLKSFSEALTTGNCIVSVVCIGVPAENLRSFALSVEALTVKLGSFELFVLLLEMSLERLVDVPKLSLAVNV